MTILDAFKRFLKGSDSKALMDIEANTDINSAKTNTSGTGQTGKIKNKGTVQIDNSTNYNFTINIPPDGDISEETKKFLREEFSKNNIQFLFQPSDHEIEDYNKFEKRSPQTNIIEFFKDKISPEDLQCLRTGLYVGELTKTNKNRAVQIKDRASLRGKRTHNIINIASAGYFELYIKPLFENKPIEEARQDYEEIVTFLPEFIFVHNNMSEQDIISELKKKITQKEKYHLQVKQIIISGLGSSVKTITSTHPKIIKKYPNYSVSLTTSDNNTLKQAKLIINLLNSES